MAMARSEEELRRLADEYGISPVTDEYGDTSYEPSLRERLCRAYREITKLVGDTAPLAILLYPYDCNNIKTVIKGELFKGEVALPLTPIGSVSIDEITDAVKLGGETGALPHNMAEGIAKAKNAYSRTASPRLIDLILDKACFEDIKEATERVGIPFFRELLAIRADTLNTLTALRIMRLGSTSAVELMEASFLCGGDVPLETFTENMNGTEAQYAETLLAFPSCEKLGRRILDGERSLSALEAACDADIMKKVRTTSSLLSGLEIAAAYLYATEYEIKDLRIIFSAKSSGERGEKILERLRESYV